MIADWILWMLGEEPGTYSDLNKWPAIGAIVTDLSIPFLIALAFAAPFLLLKLRKKPATFWWLLAAYLIGGALAYGVWWLNEWSYGYGQGVIFREIYGNDPWF